MAFETSHTDVEARILDQVIPDGARVLDAGCGRTTRLQSWRDRISELVGVDLDEVAGLENHTLDRFVAADLGNPLPFADESFDVVYANFVVEHLVDPGAAFRECHRVLRRGGDLVLLTSNQANPFLAAARLLPQQARVAVKRVGPRASERDVFPAVYRANTPARLDALLVAAGFRSVQMTMVATLHRYAGERALVGEMLKGVERLLPSRSRSTIVAWYRAT
jgi:ubiquinone/menaquinone biosynthesis C-methylase UbiE